MAKTLAEIENQLTVNPYPPGLGLIARTLGNMLNDPAWGADNTLFVSYGENIWHQLCRVLVYWTPRRVEDEALLRAKDELEPSRIAQEHHLFTAVFLEWSTHVYRWGVLAVENMQRPDEPILARKAMYLRQMVMEGLQVLDAKVAGGARPARARPA